MKGQSNPTVLVGGASAGTGTGRTVTTTPLGLVSLATAPDNRTVTISVETCSSGCSRRAYYLDGTTHVVVATTTLTSTQLTDAQLIAQGRAFLDRTLVPLQLEDRTIGTATYRQVFYMNGIQKVYVINTQDLTGLTTDIDANLLAAAMRLTGSTRVRYLLGTADLPIGVVTATFAAGTFKNADSADGSVTGTSGAQHGALVRRRRRHRRGHRPGHGWQHRRQRAQQPRLDGRRPPAARRLHAGALDHHRPGRRVHPDRPRPRLDRPRRQPRTGRPLRDLPADRLDPADGVQHRQHRGLPLLAQRPVGDRRRAARLPARGLELPGHRGPADRRGAAVPARAGQQHPGAPALRPPVRLGARRGVLDRPQGAAAATPGPRRPRRTRRRTRWPTASRSSAPATAPG